MRRSYSPLDIGNTGVSFNREGPLGSTAVSFKRKFSMVVFRYFLNDDFGDVPRKAVQKSEGS